MQWLVRPSGQMSVEAKARAFSLSLALAGLALVTALLFNASFTLPTFVGGQDKWEHAIAFAGLAFLGGLGGRARDFTLFGAFLVVVALAVEPLQPLIAYPREASFLDALAGVVGVLIGLGAACSVNFAMRGPVSA